MRRIISLLILIAVGVWAYKTQNQSRDFSNVPVIQGQVIPSDEPSPSTTDTVNGGYKVSATPTMNVALDPSVQAEANQKAIAAAKSRNLKWLEGEMRQGDVVQELVVKREGKLLKIRPSHAKTIQAKSQ
jgi:hypothetical protein